MDTRVVVVDDEPAIVDLVCEILDDVAIPVLGCQRAEQAYALIRQVQPELVLLDIQMPVLDGVAVYHQLHRDPATRHIPVVFCTANPTQLRERLPDYMMLGVGLVPKPFDVPTLIARVEQALQVGTRDPRMVPRHATALAV